jgi:hypothetical protein
MKFVIRDDDLNYFSKPSDIDRWYADIFAENIPVGFSTIPFVKPVSDVYTSNASTENKECPISANIELVAHVKNQPLIEILQHGTTHETENGIFEYQKDNGLIDDTQRGKEELQKAFGEKFQNVFVPPHDWIGNHGIRAIEAANENIIRGRGAGLRNMIMRRHYLVIFFRMVWFKLTHFLTGIIPAYPFVLNFGKHKEACSYRLDDTDVFNGLAYAHKKNGIFVVVTHLHALTNEKKERLRQLINKARGYNAEYVYPHELFI